MKRKQFLLTTLTALPAIAFASFKTTGESADKPFIVRAGDSRFGEHLKFKGINPNDVLVSKKDTDNALSLFAYTGFAKTGPSLHLHFHQDELFYVAEGSYRFVVGEVKEELNAGDTIFLPRKIAHSWIQLTNKGKLIYAVQPAGSLEEFFKEMNDFKVPPTHEQSMQIHLKHGMKLVGPPLSL